MKTWADRVKALERKLGSLEQLATKLGVSYFTVRRWRKGLNQPSAMAQTLIERAEKGAKK